jgi:iron complex outermembrane recepter protein
MLFLKVIQKTCQLLVINCLLFIPFFSIAQNQLPDSVRLQTVVIQATRTGDRSPIPHTNLTAGQIAKLYHAQDVPFLLSGVPSLVETSDAGVGTGYSGMRIRGSDQTRINVTINGVPLNDSESQAVFWVNLPDLAASAAEIQVQRGVGTSTNGASAFGATVNLDLSKVEADPFAIVTNTLGSFGTRRHSAYVGTGLLDGKVAFSGRISKIVSDGYIDRASADLDAIHLSGAYVGEKQVLQAHLLSGHEVTYQAWNGVPAQYINDDVLRRFNTAGTQKPGEPYRDEVDNYRQRHLLLHYKRQLGQGLDLQLNGHYTRGRGFFELYRAGQKFTDLNMPLPAGTNIKTTDVVLRRWLDNHFYGTTFALRWAPSVNPPFFQRGPVFMLGGAASRYIGAHFGEVIWAKQATVPNDYRYYDNDALKTDANLFGKSEFFWRGGLSTFLDLQVRRVSYDFQGFDVAADSNINNVRQNARLFFFNPKMGFTKIFNSRWNIYGFAGIANREPNRDDFVQSLPTNRPRPERLYNLEAGVRHQATKWTMQANLFYMYYRDQLVLDGGINDVGANIRTNVARSYRAGLELEAQARPISRLTLISNLALSRNRVLDFTEFRDNWDTGSQEQIQYNNTALAFSPEVIGRLSADWALLRSATQDLSVNLTGKYVGQQFLDNTSNANTALDAFFFSDLRLNYDLKNVVGERLSLIFSVNNLFNARYANNGWVYRYISESYDARPDNPYTRLEGNKVYHQAGFFPQALRHWMATVVLRF